VYTFPERIIVRWANTLGGAGDSWSIAPAEPVEWGPGQALLSGGTNGAKDGEATVDAAYNGIHNGLFVPRLHQGGEVVRKHYFSVERKQ
jgi:hypothetical protein